MSTNISIAHNSYSFLLEASKCFFVKTFYTYLLYFRVGYLTLSFLFVNVCPRTLRIIFLNIFQEKVRTLEKQNASLRQNHLVETEAEEDTQSKRKENGIRRNLEKPNTIVSGTHIKTYFLELIPTFRVLERGGGIKKSYIFCFRNGQF